MVGARSAAMGFNRLVDRRIDAANPRTAARALPAGLVSPGFVALFVVASLALLVLAAWRLNPMCVKLVAVAIPVLLGYSFTKRFTWVSHLVLGLALGGAPLGAWIAVTGALAPTPFVRRLRRAHLGRRLRRPLRAPGRGLRPRDGALLRAGALRHRRRALDLRRAPRRDPRRPRRAPLRLPAGSRRRLLGRRRRLRGPARLPARDRPPARPLAPERGLLHRQRPALGRALRGGRSPTGCSDRWLCFGALGGGWRGRRRSAKLAGSR